MGGEVRFRFPMAYFGTIKKQKKKNDCIYLEVTRSRAWFLGQQWISFIGLVSLKYDPKKRKTLDKMLIKLWEIPPEFITDKP